MQFFRAGVLAGAFFFIASPATVFAQSPPAAQEAPALRDGQRDFDFEFGAWDVTIKRLLNPLLGADEWVELKGLSTVRKVWDGRANLGELDVEGDGVAILGLSFRLYNPETRQWSIRWASSRDGELGLPMIGGFKDGRGEFYNQELYNGKAIFVRFIFSDVTAKSFKLEQAFSPDGGKKWEPNWIAMFSRRDQ